VLNLTLLDPEPKPNPNSNPKPNPNPKSNPNQAYESKNDAGRALSDWGGNWSGGTGAAKYGGLLVQVSSELEVAIAEERDALSKQKAMMQSRLEKINSPMGLEALFGGTALTLTLTLTLIGGLGWRNKRRVSCAEEKSR